MCHMNFKAKVTASTSKVIGATNHVSAHLIVMGNVHTKLEDCISNTLDTAGTTRIEVICHRCKRTD